MTLTEGCYDAMQLSAGREEEPRERRKRRANMAPAKTIHDVVQLSAGREEELRERRNRVANMAPRRGDT